MVHDITGGVRAGASVTQIVHTKKLTVGMVSDEMNVFAVNMNAQDPDATQADWTLTIDGKLTFGYATRTDEVDYEPKHEHIPRTRLPKLNYCIQKRCITQRSIFSDGTVGGSDEEWQAQVKITAAMDQNVTKLMPLDFTFEGPAPEYSAPIEVVCFQKVNCGPNCPTLKDVERALEKVKDLPWWQLSGFKVVKLIPGVKLNDMRDCTKEPQQGYEQGKNANQDAVDGDWASKEFKKVYDKTEEAIAARIFAMFAEGLGISTKVLTKTLWLLTEIQDEFGDPVFEPRGDDTLCECGSGLSHNCWKCQTVEVISYYDDSSIFEKRCVQNVPRNKMGECPEVLYDDTGDFGKTWETRKECEDQLLSQCPSTSGINQ